MVSGPPSVPGWQRALRHAWTRRNWLAWCLWPLSLGFGAAAWTRGKLYRHQLLHSRRVPAVVVVVGNVVAGGAGKTPAVIALVRHCLDHGWLVGVISRGYGRQSVGCTEVGLDSPVELGGDEPTLIKHRTGVPVFVSADRPQAALALLAAYPSTQVIVCDDGLQHQALARDVEVCMFDDRGTGNNFLLPAGPLREPWPQKRMTARHGAMATRRRGAAVRLVLHSGANPAFAGFRGTRLLEPNGIRSDGRLVALESLAGRPTMAVAAISQPDAFFAMLRTIGIRLTLTLALPDHFNFDHWSRPVTGDFTLLCTEKDARKLWRAEPDAVAVPMTFDPEPAFFFAFDDAVSQAIIAPVSSAHGHQTT